MEELARDGVPETRIADFVTQKTVEFAKNAMARPTATILTESYKEDTTDSNNLNDVKVPSLLIMCCNLYEVVRLREEIIMRMNECKILGKIYAS